MNPPHPHRDVRVSPSACRCSFSGGTNVVESLVLGPFSPRTVRVKGALVLGSFSFSLSLNALKSILFLTLFLVNSHHRGDAFVKLEAHQNT
jgi:hypothetical protein